MAKIPLHNPLVLKLFFIYTYFKNTPPSGMSEIIEDDILSLFLNIFVNTHSMTIQ